MKKLIYLLIAFIGLSIWLMSNVNAQGVGINSSGSSADPSAILDANSNTKGALMPRMTTAERNAIVNPAFGLLIFNTTTACFNMWTGASWKQICGDCDFSNPVPGNNGPLCEGQTLNLTATTVSGATYQWSGPNGFISTLQNPSIPNATAGASGSYSLTATLNGCTSAVQNTVATVNATPQTPNAGNNSPLCAGSTLNLNSTNITGASYLWTGPNSFTANTQNPTLANAQAVNAGTYSVIVTVSGCNSSPGTTTVTLIDIPTTPGLISGPASVTSYSSGNIYSISVVNGATTYNWTVPSGASITAGAGTTSIAVTFGTAGSGNIAVSASNSCGTSSASSKSVTINPTILSFTTVGIVAWTAPSGISSVEVLVVAGGGGGGAGDGGGGGGGGFIYTSGYSVIGGNVYTVTVGGGGAGALGENGSNPSTNGSNSVFDALTAIGGGRGGEENVSNGAGSDGGSGGGAGGANENNSSFGNGTSGQGSRGGIECAGSCGNGQEGGGGGAGGAGGDANGNNAGNGGPGLSSFISGTSVYYAGGGGGSSRSGGATSGGIGGGGTGGFGTNNPGSNGSPNSGGGGGGGGDQGSTGGNGGSGIVIISY